MKIKITETFSHESGCYVRGQSYVVRDELAAEVIAAQLAEEVAEAQKPKQQPKAKEEAK